MGYHLVRFLIRLVLRLAVRLEVIGLENAPLDESFVLVANHVGRLDAILIYGFTKRRDIIMLVAEKYQKIPLVKWLADQLDVIWVDRFNADFAAVRQTLTRLKQGGVLVLAPKARAAPAALSRKGAPGQVTLL